MDWTAAVDLTCERLGPGLGAEPLNAATGLVFAALGAWVGARHRGPEARALAWALVLVGATSAAQHAVGQLWASTGNLAANIALTAALGWFAGARLFGLAPVRGLAAGLAVSAAVYGAGEHGGYPLMLGLTLGAAAVVRGRTAPGLLAAAAVLGAGLALRRHDLDWCAAWPWGTHMAWHLANAAYMAVLIETAARHARRMTWTNS